MHLPERLDDLKMARGELQRHGIEGAVLERQRMGVAYARMDRQVARAGTALTSEIGLMSATDQLAAMEMMAVNPVRRVCAPRFIGGAIAMPLLAAIFSMTGIFGGQLVGVTLMGVDAGQFWSQMRSAVELRDITEGVIKSGAFGLACSAIAVYEGYYAVPTAEGVGRATTRTVVTSSVAVLVLDYMLTAVLL